MIASILLPLVMTVAQSAPVTVPAEWNPHTGWTVKVKLDGTKEGAFILGTFNPTSWAVDSWLGDTYLSDTHELSVEGLTLTKPRFLQPATEVSLGGRKAVGYLGPDILQNFAIGYDWASSTVTFWPGGHVAPEAATKWIESGARWPGETQPPQVMKIALNLDADGKLRLAGKAYGQPVEFTLIIESMNANVAPTSRPANWDPSMGLVADLGFKTFDAYSTDGPESVYVSPGSFQSMRLLVDFPALAVYRQQLSDRAMRELCLSQYFPFGVHLEGDTLKVGPMVTEVTLRRCLGESSARVGDEVLTVGTVKADDLVTLLRGKGLMFATKQGQKILDDISSAHSIALQHPDGTIFLVQVEYRPETNPQKK